MIKTVAWGAGLILWIASMGVAAYLGRQSGEEARGRAQQLEGQLNRQVARIHAVEKKLAAYEEAATKLAGSKAAPWDQLKVGMSRSEVERLLGRPTDEAQSATTTWTYEYPADGKRGTVEFSRRMTVVSWQAP